MTPNWRVITPRLLAWLFFGVLALYALWPWLPFTGQPPQRTVVVYGFSILGEVMNAGIFPRFEEQWKAETGEDIEFISAFASSGTVTNQIIMGAPAEIAILSLELDALRLVEAQVVPGPVWRQLPDEGVLNTTPFIIIVRPGNPKAIQDFVDLAAPGVGVVHPDPLTSGGAQWAILAEYGSALRMGLGEEQAYQQLLGIWQNVVAQASSARGARTQFESGFGDALITYEQEALSDQLAGRFANQVVYPQSTIASEHTVVVIDKNIPAGDEALVSAFIDFLWSREAQEVFIAHGFRSNDELLNAAADDLVPIEDPFRVGDLGGWVQAKQTIIETIWKARVLPQLGQ